MVSKNVTNTTKSPLGLPRGAVVRPGATIRVDDWEKKESNTVVQAWIAAGALTVADAPAREAPAKKLSGAKLTLDVLRTMTKDELTILIQNAGGTVPPAALKDELVTQAHALPA